MSRWVPKPVIPTGLWVLNKTFVIMIVVSCYCFVEFVVEIYLAYKPQVSLEFFLQAIGKQRKYTDHTNPFNLMQSSCVHREQSQQSKAKRIRFAHSPLRVGIQINESHNGITCWHSITTKFFSRSYSSLNISICPLPQFSQLIVCTLCTIFTSVILHTKSLPK